MRILGLLLSFLIAAASPAFATSTINPNIPATDAPLASAPIRGNFTAAYNDVNALQAAVTSLASLNIGPSQPFACTTAVSGAWWLNNAAPLYQYLTCDGPSSSWLLVFSVDTVNNLLVPQIGGGTEGNISASGTTDLGSIPQAVINVIGASSISSFGSSAPVGTIKFLVFASNPTLVYSSPGLVLPFGQNLATSAGATAIAVETSSGNWTVWNYQPPYVSASNSIRVIGSGVSDSPITGDFVIKWSSANTASKTETLANCSSATAANQYLIIDGQGNAGTYNIIISSNSIDGSGTYVISQNYGSVWLKCDGISTWTILLTQNPSSSSTGNLTVNGTLTVTGNTTLQSALSVSGATTLSNTLSVADATTLSGTLGVSGAATLSSTLGVTGATTLSSTLGVTGATTLSSTLGVSGAATLSSTLGVTGATTLSSTLNVTGASTFAAGQFNGTVTFPDTSTWSSTGVDLNTLINGQGNISTGPTVDSYGLSYQSDASYSAQTIYNMSVCAAFPCSPSPTFLNYDAVRGASAAISGTNVTNVTGVAGYVFDQIASSGSAKNAVAVFGASASAVNSAATWGINTISTDNTSQTSSSYTGDILQGYEGDFNITSTSSEVFGISLEGASIAQPTVANGFSVGILGSGILWTTGFITADGCCTNALAIGTENTSGTNAGQNLILFNDYNSVANNSLVIQASGGILNITTPEISATPQAIPSGSSNLSIYVADNSGGKGHMLNVSVEANSSCGSARCLTVPND